MNENESRQYIAAYAAYNKEKQIRLGSSSGGIFFALADHILSKGGIVYGVAMSEDCYSAEFLRIEKTDDLPKIMTSKYLQAVVGETFKQVKRDLEEDRDVLFSGTGCQVNGLVGYLGKTYEKLLLVDIICHGVPSPALWRNYVIYQESKYGKLISVNFRCKEKGWKEFGIKENHLFFSKEIDPFMRLFLSNFSLRPSCYECHAKVLKQSDITIGDFWGVEKVIPELDDGLGTSLVILRTEKGQEVFNDIREWLIWKEVDYYDSVKYNIAEFRSVTRPKSRDTFFKDMNHLSLEKLAKKYTEGPFRKKIFRKIKHVMKHLLSFPKKTTRKTI